MGNEYRLRFEEDGICFDLTVHQGIDAYTVRAEGRARGSTRNHTRLVQAPYLTPNPETAIMAARKAVEDIKLDIKCGPSYMPYVFSGGINQ